MSSDRMREELGRLIQDVNQFYSQVEMGNVYNQIVAGKYIVRYLGRLGLAWYKSELVSLVILVTDLVVYRTRFTAPTSSVHIFKYGHTRNNILALERLMGCLGSDVSERFYISRNGGHQSLLGLLNLFFDSELMKAGVESLSQSKQVSPYTLIQSSLACASYLYYSKFLQVKRLKVVCVANDHSPLPLGLVRYAMSIGVKTCYIQHAPVTQLFPSLNFDLSILHNKQSVNIYRIIAAKRSRVKKSSSQIVSVLPPFDDNFVMPTFKSDRYTVGLCLSYLFDSRGVSRLIDSLLVVSCIERIVLRVHPRTPISSLSKIDGINKVDVQKMGNLKCFLSSIDLVLVPNSGVTVECLHFGKAVCYVHGTDYLEEDYYGFVKGGIIPRFSRYDENSISDIICFFDTDWRRKFAVWDETVEGDLNRMKKSVKEQFYSLLDA